MCQQVLDSLMDERFLCATSDGHYARVTSVEIIVRPHSAKAELAVVNSVKAP
jgi:hypothetical protein